MLRSSGRDIPRVNLVPFTYLFVSLNFFLFFNVFVNVATNLIKRKPDPKHQKKETLPQGGKEEEH